MIDKKLMALSLAALMGLMVGNAHARASKKASKTIEAREKQRSRTQKFLKTFKKDFMAKKTAPKVQLSRSKVPQEVVVATPGVANSVAGLSFEEELAIKAAARNQRAQEALSAVEQGRADVMRRVAEAQARIAATYAMAKSTLKALPAEVQAANAAREKARIARLTAAEAAQQAEDRMAMMAARDAFLTGALDRTIKRTTAQVVSLEKGLRSFSGEQLAKAQDRLEDLRAKLTEMQTQKELFRMEQATSAKKKDVAFAAPDTATSAAVQALRKTAIDGRQASIDAANARIAEQTAIANDPIDE